jgi:hypothetical protein
VHTLKIEFPPAFRNSDQERQQTLHVGAFVRVAYTDDDGEHEFHLRINRFSLLVLPGGERVPYIWPFWYQDEKDQDPLLQVRCVRPRALNLRQYNLPVLIDTVIEQVLIVHKCTFVCTEDADEKHIPGQCDHVCRVRNACDEHQLADCDNAACRRTEWKGRLFHNSQPTHRVFDRQTGFVIDTIPQMLGDTDFDAPLQGSDL